MVNTSLSRTLQPLTQCRIYDADPKPSLAVIPGALPPDIDPQLEIPHSLPLITSPNDRERFAQTPVYASLTSGSTPII
jgi:hypothetical protein